MPDLIRPDLDAIEARANAAQRGPWEVFGTDDPFILGPDPLANENRPTGAKLPRPQVIEDHSGSEGGGYRIAVADAEFIGHAREDVPALVAYVRRLDGLVGQFLNDGDQNVRRTPYGFDTADPDLAAALDRRREQIAAFGNEPTWRDEVQFVAGWKAAAEIERLRAENAALRAGASVAPPATRVLRTIADVTEFEREGVVLDCADGTHREFGTYELWYPAQSDPMNRVGINTYSLPLPATVVREP